jgi:hypothetical protein
MRNIAGGTRHFPARRLVLLFILAAAIAGWNSSVSARQWKATPQAQAQDYLEIIDQRGGSIIVIWWLASPMAPNNPEVVSLLDKYVVILALHAQMDATAVATYTEITSLDVRDASQNALTPVSKDKMPPALTGGLTTVVSALSQALGPMGQHVQYFVFESGGINACRHGRLFVNYNGEAYSYDMPIPGC